MIYPLSSPNCGREDDRSDAAVGPGSLDRSIRVESLSYESSSPDVIDAPGFDDRDGALLDAYSRAVSQAAERVSPSVVQIRVQRGGAKAGTRSSKPRGRGPRQTPRAPESGTGSGFLFTPDGFVLTNSHVVHGASRIEVARIDGSTCQAFLIGDDPETDLAVVRIDGEQMIGAELGDASTLKVGQLAIAIGNPLGFEQTVTTGIVSALKRYISSPNDATISNVIQTDAAINQGNSGGPLLDLQGRVVGINSQIATENGGNVGIGFAVPIDLIKPTVASIIADGTAEHAWIGIKGTQLTPRVATANGLGDQRGVMVVSLDSRGPARKAGLKGATSGTSDNPDAIPKGGDVIVAVDGTAVQDMGDVSLDIASKAVGDEVTITVLRDGARKEFTVKLADRPADIK